MHNAVTSHYLLVRMLLIKTILSKHPILMLIQISIYKLIVDFVSRLP